MNEYERKRTEKIAANKALLAELSKINCAGKLKTSQPVIGKKKRPIDSSLTAPAARKSARIAEKPQVARYHQTAQAPSENIKGRRSKNKTSRKLGLANDDDDLVSASSSAEHPNMNEIKSGWTSWLPEAPSPTREPDGTYCFASHPKFKPNLSPQQVMQQGSFGGTYWRPVISRRLGTLVEGDWEELPVTWIAGLDIGQCLTSPDYDPSINKYGIKCGQTIEEWEANGWINHEYDVRGWFQWYCRYFQGRRCVDDDRQIRRWVACAGITGRWRNLLLGKYIRAGIRTVSDEGLDDEVGVSPAIHQTLHHWAWELRQEVLDDYWDKLD